MSDEHIPSPPPPHEMDAAPLFVSLFLMLLVFFIVLNSMAKPDPAKARGLMRGLGHSFSDAGTEEDTNPKDDFIPHSQGSDAALTVFYGDMKKMAASYIQAEDMALSLQGNDMIMQVPVRFLFSGDNPALRSGQAQILRDIAASLLAWQKEIRLEVECRVGYTPPLTAEAENLAVARSSAIAAALVAAGVPASAVQPGINEGTADKVTFRFVPRHAGASWPVPAKAQP